VPTVEEIIIIKEDKIMSRASRDKKMNRALKTRDIETVLWELCQDCVEDFRISSNCKIGRQTFSNLLSTLSQMEMLKRRRDDKNYDMEQANELKEMEQWLKVVK